MVIQSGGNVKIHAVGDVESEAEAELSISQDAAGGRSVSLSFDDSPWNPSRRQRLPPPSATIGSLVDATQLSSPTTTLFMPNHGFKTGEGSGLSRITQRGVASPLADPLSGDRFYVVAIDDSHLQLVREPAVDVNLDGFAPYDPQAPNPSQQTLSGFRNVSVNSSTAGIWRPIASQSAPVHWRI